MSEYADTDANISERRHDPLCYYRDDEWIAVQDCAECTMIAHVRADERDKPINAIPRAICNSESFMWLMVGSNHLESQLNALRPAWVEYRNVGGGWGTKLSNSSQFVRSERDDPTNDKSPNDSEMAAVDVK